MERMIDVCEVTKIYSRKGPTANFRETLMQKWNGLFHPVKAGPEYSLTALHNLSFDLQAGDVLGVIGNNGAGKTTLLKILAGIVKPSSGNIYYKGKLLSILDFGTGFHPELSGRENIFLSGSLLGLSRSDIVKQYEAIVEFSELGDKVNDIVKYYSNGMYLRLAFSVFSHLRSDILLLDEVISVGDFGFRQKCQDRISYLARSGTTILLVSHYADQIRYLCNKCLWIDKGENRAFGATEKVMEQYIDQHRAKMHEHSGNSSIQYWPEGEVIKDEIVMYRYELRAANKNKSAPLTMNDELEIEIEFEKLHNGSAVTVAFSISSIYNAWVLVESYGLYSEFEQRVSEKGRYICTCKVPGGILNFGIYQLGLMVSLSEQLIYQQASMMQFTIHFNEREGVKSNLAQGSKSIMQPSGNWKVEKVG